MMNTRIAICLTLAAAFFGAQGATITFTNNCPYTVWPATLTSPPNPQLSKTGFELPTGQSDTVDVPAPWSGRFWGRTGCSDKAGQFTCDAGDCGSDQVACDGKGGVPPATLAELHVGANGGQDYYDISNVDGFNVPMSIAPQGGRGDCQPSSCPANVTGACLKELQQKRPDDGNVVGCMSACAALKMSQYCCTGAFSTADKCPPTNYSEFFEQQCPLAYSYAYDDKNSLFTCFEGPNYNITFCLP